MFQLSSICAGNSMRAGARLDFRHYAAHLIVEERKFIAAGAKARAQGLHLAQDPYV